MGPPPPPAVTLENLCAELARVDCDRLAACGTRTATLSAAQCSLRMSKVDCGPIAEQLSKAVAMGMATFDAAKGDACRSAVGARACEIPLERSVFEEEACAQMVAGAREVGQSCSDGTFCKDGLWCDASAMTCPGQCRAFKKNAEACGFDAPCEEGFFCSATARVCRARVALGSRCETSLAGNSCAGASFCENNVGGATCVAVRGRKTGCTSPYQCAAGLSCIANLCSGGLDGDTCEGTGDCEKTLVCAPDGKCRKPVAGGEVCTQGAAPCREGFTCTASAGMSLCAAKRSLGERCGSCYLSRCVNGTCAALAEDGAACATRDDCYPGRACVMSRCVVPFVCAL